MRRRRVLVSVIVVGVLAASACTRSVGDGGSAAGDPLDGRSFVSTRVLEGGSERPLVPGTRIELSFSDGRLSARAGCNLMGAGYRLEGGRLRLVGNVGMTEMGCDPERHDQDAWLSAFLGSSPRVELRGPRLVLSAGGTELHLLDREVAEPDLPLEGTLWTLETIVRGELASSVPAGLRAELRLWDGRIGGFNGCNRWGGRVVSTEGGVLVLRDVGQTLKRCTGAAAALERDVNALVTAERIAYEITARGLVLRAGERELHFRGQPAPSA